MQKISFYEVELESGTNVYQSQRKKSVDAKSAEMVQADNHLFMDLFLKELINDINFQRLGETPDSLSSSDKFEMILLHYQLENMTKRQIKAMARYGIVPEKF